MRWWMLFVLGLAGCDLGGSQITEGCGDGGCNSDFVCSEADDCDDHDDCTEDLCAAGICQHEALPEFTLCDDNNPCTVNDRCQDGHCQGTAVDCSSLDGECVYGFCDIGSGACMEGYLDVTTICTDDLFCTVEEHCDEGLCLGTLRDCDDGEEDTVDSCLEEERRCVNALTP